MTALFGAPDPLLLEFQNAVAGRYAIDRELGRGGMGVVFLARDVQLDRWVAIKVLPPALAGQAEQRARFVREAQLAAKLSHPHIVPIHAVEDAGTHVYFVMAYVAGETLAQRVQARGPLPASEGARVLREVAWALGYAHAQGVVHRDVKPDNILLEADSGRALVADFGIAAASERGATGSQTAAGTPEFMSPEQALGGAVDARSDLYSLGATAFYAFSGRVPFEGKTATEVLARVVTGSAPSLASVGAVAGVAVPRAVSRLVDQCLSTDPAHRPTSAHALADQLSAALEQRRELPAALRAFVKRNGRTDGAGTLAGLIGALVAGVSVSAFAGPTAGVLTIAGAMAVSAVGFGIAAAKRLMDLGFTHGDLAPAYRTELAISREERGFTRRVGLTLVERALRSVAGVMSATSTVLLAAALVSPGEGLRSTVGNMAVFGLLLSTLPLLGHLLLLQLRRDVDVEFWSAAWTGRPGRWAFAIAKRWRGTTPVGPALTHRATELSLGMAAEHLFETLPKASREALGDVPVLLQQLQRDAERLRKRADQLNAGAPHVANSGINVATDHQMAITSERETVQRRLRETVAALESIRLSLLRLHAGTLTLETFTTDLGRAEDVAADVNRLIAAHEEVGAVLRFPQHIELTPV